MSQESHRPAHRLGRKGYFKGEDGAEIRALMQRIGQGDADATNQFLKRIDWVANKHANRIAANVFGDAVDEEIVKEGLQDVLLHLVIEGLKNPQLQVRFFSGADDSWRYFNQRLTTDLHDKYQSIRKEMETEQVGLRKMVASAPAEQLSIPATEAAYFALRRKVEIEDKSRYLNPREKLILKLRTDGESLEDIGTKHTDTGDVGIFGLSRGRVRQIEHEAMNRLKREDIRNGDRLRSYVDDEDIRRTGRPEDFFR